MASETLSAAERDSVEKDWTSSLLTAGEFAKLAEEIGPAELVGGRIIKKPMNNHIHGRIVAHLSGLLDEFAARTSSGVVLAGEVGIYTKHDPDTARAADVVFISHERYQRVQSSVYLDVPPELVIEIISPENRWSDIFEKIHEYFSIGVDSVWTIDPALREARAFSSPAEAQLLQASKDEALTGTGLLADLRISLDDLFAVTKTS